MLMKHFTNEPRTCGECTACCWTHNVKEIRKPMRRWCPDCTQGVGCKRYETRPGACKEFSCAWLWGYGPDSDRPDKLGVVQSADLENWSGVVIAEFTPGAMDSPRVTEIIREYIAHGSRVNCVSVKGQWAPLEPKPASSTA